MLKTVDKGLFPVVSLALEATRDEIARLLLFRKGARKAFHCVDLVIKNVFVFAQKARSAFDKPFAAFRTRVVAKREGKLCHICHGRFIASGDRRLEFQPKTVKVALTAGRQYQQQ